MPSELQTSKTFFLISGIINILILLGWSGTTIFSGLITCGVGCLFGVIPIINLAACIMDFVAYSRLNALSATGIWKTMHFTSVLEIVTILTGNIVSLIFGIMILNYLNNPEVINFLKEKNLY